ncbi:MAG: glycogen synthase GlgA [Verrucomicrobia bacterium]|nr:glycogen synthase GlgA [Verrucomicrobiota bacterium]
MTPLRILLASSEVFPYSKTGGLADMVGAFAKSLAHEGHRVGVVTPLYRGIRERFPDLARFDWHLDLPLGFRRVQAEVWTLNPTELLTIYFIQQPEFYHRATLYQDNGADYPDNAERFIFFSKCVTNLARFLPWQPELVHVHDWQTALVPLFLWHQRMREGWDPAPRTCLTIHNLAYQGLFPRAAYELTNLPGDYFHPNGVEFFGGLNCLKAGIAYADVITTVSPRYAREITTEAFGCGLDGLLRQRQHSLVGILNGVDYEEWRTTRNPHLASSYSVRNLAGKTKQKLHLQHELGLPVHTETPLFGNVTRLVDQKGVDIQLGALEEMLSADLQFALLGSGAPYFEQAYLQLARRHPKKVAVKIGYDHGLAHRVEAGSDFFLMPSRFEPCGLNQMYSHRYGTVPIVRATGGLDDSVCDISEDAEHVNGIKFHEYSARALAKAIRKALVLYRTPDLLRYYRVNAMKDDFSWKQTTAKYLEAFDTLLNQHPGQMTQLDAA